MQLFTREDDPHHEQWQENHKVDSQKNYDGSADSMEAECAKRLWNSSVEKLNLRYKAVLSEGDSKSYDVIVNENIYGPENGVEKEECVNHVSKQMGTALNNLLSSSGAPGQSISGKGKLTRTKF